MACKCAPALIKLRDQLNASFPNRDKASDGCCGDEAHSTRTSDHNPTDGYAHAYDVDEDVEPGHGDQPLLEWVPALLRDARTKYIIYEQRLYYPDGTVKAYTGVNAHAHHLHLSIKLDVTFNASQWPMPFPHHLNQIEEVEMIQISQQHPEATIVVPPGKTMMWLATEFAGCTIRLARLNKGNIVGPIEDDLFVVPGRRWARDVSNTEVVSIIHKSGYPLGVSLT